MGVHGSGSQVNCMGAVFRRLNVALTKGSWLHCYLKGEERRKKWDASTMVRSYPYYHGSRGESGRTSLANVFSRFNLSRFPLEPFLKRPKGGASMRRLQAWPPTNSSKTPWRGYIHIHLQMSSGRYCHARFLFDNETKEELLTFNSMICCGLGEKGSHRWYCWRRCLLVPTILRYLEGHSGISLFQTETGPLAPPIQCLWLSHSS